MPVATEIRPQQPIHTMQQRFITLDGINSEKRVRKGPFGLTPLSEISPRGDALIAADIWEHGKLQNQFDAVLGRKYDAKDMLTRSYNPVTDRWHIERLRRKDDLTGEEAYKQEVRTNLGTNLRERLQVGENIVRYRIEGNELFSQDFPNESFSDVLRRGAAYRLGHGTLEAEREGQEGELGGWEKLRAKFTDPNTAVGTKMTVFSPPGMVEDSAYDRALADEYEFVVGKEGKKCLQLTRRIVDFDEVAYASAALAHDPHYFDAFDGRPLDAWYLSHPMEGSLSNLTMNGMDATTFDKIYQSPMLQGMISSYIEAITAADIDWKQVALTINAIYNQVDVEEKAVVQGTGKEQQLYVSQDTVRAEVQHLGWITPETKGGNGCPTSKGYSMFSNTSNVSGWNRAVESAFPAGDSSAASCPKISCPCGWEANSSEVVSIHAGILTRCPECKSLPGQGVPEKKEPEDVPTNKKQALAA